MRQFKIKLVGKKPTGVFIKSAKDCVDLLQKSWDKDQIVLQESVWIILISRSNEVLGFKEMFVGGQAVCSIDHKLICACAINAMASAVVMAHNHPSGNTRASDIDIRVAKRLKEALGLFEIALLDSIIITPNFKYLSMADGGLL